MKTNYTQYSVFSYYPSRITGERINLGIVFYRADKNPQFSFFYTQQWNRIKEFVYSDEISLFQTLSISLELLFDKYNKDENNTTTLKDIANLYDNDFYFSFSNPIAIDFREENEYKEIVEELLELYFPMDDF